MKTTLILLRHGQSEPFHPDGDFTRRLTPKGAKDARDAGAGLAARGLAPDGILYSPATRTTMTLEAVKEGMGDFACMPVSDDSIYEADTDTLMRVLESSTGNRTTLLLVGHNPGLSMLTDRLARDDLEQKNLFASLSPGSMAILDCGENWCNLAANKATIIDLVNP